MDIKVTDIKRAKKAFGKYVFSICGVHNCILISFPTGVTS
jgi:hypothetical protein